MYNDEVNRAKNFIKGFIWGVFSAGLITENERNFYIDNLY